MTVKILGIYYYEKYVTFESFELKAGGKRS